MIIICNCVAGLQLTALLCWSVCVIEYSISVSVRSNVSGWVEWIRASEWRVGLDWVGFDDEKVTHVHLCSNTDSIT